MSGIFGRGVSAVYQIESAWGAAFPTTGTWIPLSAYELSNGETRGLEADPLLGRQDFNRRDPNASAPVLPQAAGQIVVPVCLREIGYWLCATFGAPVTTGAGPYTHVWESGKDAVLSLVQSKKLKDNLFRRGRGLMVNTLAINLQKESGYPRMTLGVMQKDEVKSTSDVSGTIADAFDLLRVPNSKPFVKRNGVAAPATAFSFNYSNQLERFDALNGAEYPDALDPGDSQISGNFTVRYEDATYDDIADAVTKEPWSFGWEKTANEKLTFEIEGARIAREGLPISGPGRLFATYQLLPEQSGAAPAITVTLVNDVEGYPPPP